MAKKSEYMKQLDEQIIRAARQIFEKDGMALRMEDVARAVEKSVGRMYATAKTKEALIALALIVMLDELKTAQLHQRWAILLLGIETFPIDEEMRERVKYAERMAWARVELARAEWMKALVDIARPERAESITEEA